MKYNLNMASSVWLSDIPYGEPFVFSDCNFDDDPVVFIKANPVIYNDKTGRSTLTTEDKKEHTAINLGTGTLYIFKDTSVIPLSAKATFDLKLKEKKE